MKTINKLLDGIEKVQILLVSVLVVTLLVICSIEVVRRYFFGISWQWSDELERYIIIWVSFLGGAIAYRRGLLANFDLFLSKLTGKTRDRVLIVENFICLLILGVSLYFSCVKVFSPSILTQKAISMDLPMAAVYAAIPVGLLSMILINIESTLELVCKLRKEGSDG